MALRSRKKAVRHIVQEFVVCKFGDYPEQIYIVNSKNEFPFLHKVYVYFFQSRVFKILAMSAGKLVRKTPKSCDFILDYTQ
jgi:hypothetical protein